MGRLIKIFVKEWTEDITKEVSIIQDQCTGHGKQNIHRKKESVCATHKKQTRSDSETSTTKST